MRRVTGILAFATLCVAAIGCAARTPRAKAPAARQATAPEVRKHLLGTWWREHRTRTQALQLGSDGGLKLIGVPPLVGLDWRVEGRYLYLRMRAVESGDLYEDKLYLGRLTDRTLVAEANDSYFAGTYKRRRADVAEPRTTPAVGHQPTLPEPTPLPAIGGAALVQPIELRRRTAETLPPRDSWLTTVADLSECSQSLNTRLCPRFYSDPESSLLLVEVCEDGRRLPKGMSFLNLTGGVASYPWFDPAFGRFACENGCNSAETCRYEVTATSSAGQPTEVVYRFDIGPSWGWVRLELGANGAVRVLEHRVNQPQ